MLEGAAKERRWEEGEEYGLASAPHRPAQAMKQSQDGSEVATPSPRQVLGDLEPKCHEEAASPAALTRGLQGTLLREVQAAKRRRIRGTQAVCPCGLETVERCREAAGLALQGGAEETG